ncbi:PREDICTED: nodal modulator 1-like isoform X4 [Lupinus angustifolius]|uniref:nodal modulator 1-like isoform X4 n=1 Tax=Lupinus angustifolius TaxID=3871 RepID=UPI00092EA310|nr:PREDICTED: nodal modulator 1-like isoform X4 [Lupinus angustifolius]
MSTPFTHSSLLFIFFIATLSISHTSADSIYGCGGFVQASSSLVKSRKQTDSKLDYSHVTVELQTLDGLVKDSTQCAPNGYYFIPVYDKGSFVIKINGPEGWSWDPEKVPVVVDNHGCNGNEDINFRFTGFTISGRVVGAVGGGSCSVKNGGPSNVKVELLSPSGDLLSSVLTSQSGSYLFTNIIPGKYELHASNPDMKVEVKGSTQVELGFGNVVVDDVFFVPGHSISGFVVAQVTGFSIGGRVVDGNEVGVEGVKITVDGHERSITDNQGYYKLDQVTSKHYTIEARKEHYKFKKLEKYMVLPNMAAIEDINAISYDICGSVRMVGAGLQAKVALTHGPENVKPQKKQTDGNGNFCFEVLPGEYRLSAIAASPENAPGLLFLPSYIDVVVKSPLLNVQFSQTLVNIHGAVTCKEKCGPSVSVTLVRQANKHNEERRTIRLSTESSEFHFSDVIPGKYRLEVKHSSLDSVTLEDNWCWEQSFIDVNVGAEDLEGILFVQKGYWVNVISTHEVNGYITQPDGSTVNLKIQKGSQHICIEYPGVHEFNFVDSCILFGSSSVKIDTSNLSPISLKGEKYLLKGQINVQSSSLNALPENIVVDIQKDGIGSFDSAKAILKSHEKDQTNTAIFEYSVWVNLGEKLTFVPRDSRNDGEKKFLFYPREHHVSVADDNCQAYVPTFSCRLGVYIEGSVSPPLSGVDIRVFAAGDSSIASLKSGELVLETTTGTDGSYVTGPLYDDIGYNVEASKPGYHIKQVEPHSFSCQKLSQISVRIHHIDDAEEPIPSVLLSLSGDNGYRNNSVSGVGGTFPFDNLFPGMFYLRPVLKEYAFSPPSQAIELGAGEVKEVIFQATRVAYSATGLVTLLSGQPKGGVSVEARAESKGYFEETVTDSSGNYRLRGLHPDTVYVVKVSKRDVLGNSNIERASPDSVSVKVGTEDIKGLDFIVFEEPEITIVSCHVEGNTTDELHKHLMVEIKSASDSTKIESVFPLPISNFFQVKGLSKGRHLLQLRSALPPSSLKFESDIIEVDLEKNIQIHVGPLRYRIIEDHLKQELTPAPVLTLVVGFLFIALVLSIPRLKDWYDATVDIPTPGLSASSRRDVKKPTLRKKTY